MRLNPFQLRRIEKPTETRAFTDPAAPGQELVIAFKALDAAEQAWALQRAEELARQYIGDPTEGVAPTAAFPPIDGEAVPLTETLLRSAVWLAAMQQPLDGIEPYTAEEWVAISLTLPTAYRGIAEFQSEVQRRFRSQGNSSPAEVMGSSSGRASADSDNTRN